MMNATGSNSAAYSYCDNNTSHRIRYEIRHTVGLINHNNRNDDDDNNDYTSNDAIESLFLVDTMKKKLNLITGTKQRLKYEITFTVDVFTSDPDPILARIECDFGPGFKRQRYFVQNRFKLISKKDSSTNHNNNNNNNYSINATYLNNNNSNNTVWRCFESKQQTFGIPETVKFVFVGMDGTRRRLCYSPKLEIVKSGDDFFCAEPRIMAPPLFGDNGNENGRNTNHDQQRQTQHLKPIALPPDREYSLQRGERVGLSVSPIVPQQQQQQQIIWQKGEEGIKNIRDSNKNNDDDDDDTITFVNAIISVKLFKTNHNSNNNSNSTGSKKKNNNVHNKWLLNLCQNFIKYEQVWDQILQIHRELRLTTEIIPPPDYLYALLSNRDAVLPDNNNNRKKHLRLKEVASYSKNNNNNVPDDLIRVMNPSNNVATTTSSISISSSSYEELQQQQQQQQRYKLTISYRKEEGGSASSNDDRYLIAQFCLKSIPNNIESMTLWVRFCALFVHNSCWLRSPSNFKQNKSMEEQTEILFASVIRDRYVEELLLGKNNTNAATTLLFDDEYNNDTDAQCMDSSISEFSIPSGSIYVSESDRKRVLSEVGPYDYDDNPNFPPDKRHQSSVSSPPSSLQNISTIMQQQQQNNNDNRNISSIIPNLQLLTFSGLSNDNKNLTADKMKYMCKKLNIPVRNQKKKLLEGLQDYFRARDQELKEFFNNNSNIDDNEDITDAATTATTAAASGKFLGLEIFIDYTTTTGCNDDDDQKKKNVNIVRVILKGGKISTATRTNVCEKLEIDNYAELTEHEAELAYQRVYPITAMMTNTNNMAAEIATATATATTQSNNINYIQMIDQCLGVIPNNDKNEDCQFALIHNLIPPKR